jgi:hypothetical protein
LDGGHDVCRLSGAYTDRTGTRAVSKLSKEVNPRSCPGDCLF